MSVLQFYVPTFNVFLLFIRKRRRILCLLSCLSCFSQPVFRNNTYFSDTSTIQSVLISEVGINTHPFAGEEDPLKKVADATADASLGRNMMEDMPCVSTRGDGPNGRRIEGLLYRYKKGEDVRIVCVCHGSFLTPAEFVKHAGGGDVAHPLRHIVVNPSPPALL